MIKINDIDTIKLHKECRIEFTSNYKILAVDSYLNYIKGDDNGFDNSNELSELENYIVNNIIANNNMYGIHIIIIKDNDVIAVKYIMNNMDKFMKNGLIEIDLEKFKSEIKNKKFN